MDANKQRHLLSTIGSERATGGHGNKIVTFDGITHVVWQDVSSDGYLNRVRSFDHHAATWSPTVTLNTGVDNHARPVITVDRAGYLHVVLSGHGTPVTYRRSLQPNDASQWTPEEPAGAGTYPVLFCDPGGTLFMTMRPDRPIGVDLFVKPPSGRWRRQARLVQRTARYMDGYAAYHNHLCMDDRGVLHFAVLFYEGTGVTDQRGLHQAVCYLRSADRGASWQRADGTAVAVPAAAEQMDLVARTVEQRHEPMPPPEVVCVGMVPDGAGGALLLCISHRERPGALTLHHVDAAGSWQQHAVDAVERAYPDMRPVGGHVGVRDDGSLCALLTLQPLDQGWRSGHMTRAASQETAATRRTVWLLSDRERTQYTTLGEIEPGTPANTPAVERPVGANPLPAGTVPSYAFFDGSADYPVGLLDYFADVQGYLASGKLLTNNVYWVASRNLQ